MDGGIVRWEIYDNNSKIQKPFTGKLVQQASNFFNPSPKEAPKAEDAPNPEPKLSTTETNLDQRTESDGPYGPYGPFDAVIVDASDLPPVRSHVNPDQPLRPKPPSDGAFRVTPSPNLNNYGQIGVQNPNFYNYEQAGPTTEQYGPHDFMVETVKLDKDFFHQFFTSKPLLIGTDVVTSKSVKVDKTIQTWPRKRSRKTSAELPDSLVDFSQKLAEIANPSKLRQMALKHAENRKVEDSQDFLSTFTTTIKTTPSTSRTSTKTTTSLPRSTTGKISDVPKIINSVKTFTRYYIPPEVKISHAVATSDH